MKELIKRILRRDKLQLEFGEMTLDEFLIREKLLREILIEIGDEYD